MKTHVEKEQMKNYQPVIVAETGSKGSVELESFILNIPSTWKTVGVRIRVSELPLLNKQLDRLNYVTLGDLAKDLIAGKITRLTDDQQIDVMNTNLQTTGQITGLSGKPYDFYKQIDIIDFSNYLDQLEICGCIGLQLSLEHLMLL